MRLSVSARQLTLGYCCRPMFETFIDQSVVLLKRRLTSIFPNAEVEAPQKCADITEHAASYSAKCGSTNDD